MAVGAVATVAAGAAVAAGGTALGLYGMSMVPKLESFIAGVATALLATFDK